MKRRRARVMFTDDGLAGDERRRLINALLALAQMDAGWMVWAERNLARNLSVRQLRIRVERQARLLLAGRYRFLGRAAWLGIVYGDHPFTDDLNLKTYF